MSAMAVMFTLAAAVTSSVPAQERFEVAALRALREEERHGWGLALSWRRSPESALGIEWLEHAHQGGRVRRDLALRWSVINPEPLWRPSFEIALGRAAGAGRAAAWVASLGVGGRWDLTAEGGGLRLAAELRFRREERTLPGERGLIALIGLALPFGERGAGRAR